MKQILAIPRNRQGFSHTKESPTYLIPRNRQPLSVRRCFEGSKVNTWLSMTDLAHAYKETSMILVNNRGVFIIQLDIYDGGFLRK